MNIDAHQHFWVYDPTEYEWIDDSMNGLRRDFLPADLESELKSNGMQACVAVQARQSLQETRWLLELAASAAFIVGVVGWVDLRSPRVRTELEELARNPKLVGVRHIVQSEPDGRFLLQPEFLRGVALLKEFDLAYDILIYPRHFAVAAEFASQFPEQRFVLDHMAKPPVRSGSLHEWHKGLCALASLPNVYCKLSGLVTEADWKNWTPQQIEPCLDAAFDAFGAQRLMIGSDWPVCTLAASYSQTLGLVRNYLSRYPPAVQEAVLGENARTFWNLK